MIIYETLEEMAKRWQNITPQEALPRLVNMYKVDNLFMHGRRNEIEVAIVAVAKQIHKKPIAKKEYYSLHGYSYESTLYYCPCCNSKFNGEMIIVTKTKMKHCPNCGQALNWEGTK